MVGVPLHNSVVSLDLAAGSYVVTGATSLRKTNSQTKEISCSIISTSGSAIGSEATAQFDPSRANHYYAFSPTAAVRTSSPTTVAVRCDVDSNGFFNGAAASNGATITAVRVGELTEQ